MVVATCMARLLTVVVSTRQLPPARLTTGPLLGTTAYHPGFLFTTVAGHGHGLRTGGTRSYIMFNNLSSYMSINEDSNKVKSKAMIHSYSVYIKIIKTNVRLACNDEPFFYSLPGTLTWMTQEQTGVSTFRLQVSSTRLPTGVGHKPRVKLWVCFFSTEADVFCRTVFLLVLCSTFRTVRYQRGHDTS